MQFAVADQIAINPVSAHLDNIDFAPFAVGVDIIAGR
jgi:hypothetical protein